MIASVTQSFAVRSIGPLARRTLDEPSDGRIVAVFRSAFYVESGSQLICIATATLEPGPLTLICSAPDHLDWRENGVCLRSQAATTPLEVRVGRRFRFPMAGANTWSPDPFAEALDTAAIALGLTAFRDAARSKPIVGGLGRFIDSAFSPEQHDHVSRAAKAPIAEARRWLTRYFTCPQETQRGDLAWIGALTGLGRGLTPSGDDFLGGMLIALHALWNKEISRLLWDGIRPCAEKGTNAISFALLKAASEGVGSASVHRSVSGILRGDIVAIHESMPGIGRIGHSSGWDAMTGAVTVLDCWLQLQGASVA